MKRIILFSALVILSFYCTAQTVKLSDIEKMMEGNLIVGLTSNDTINEYFKEAIAEFWTVKEITEYLPYAEAREKAKNDKSTYVMYLTTGSSSSPSRQALGSNLNYKYISKSKRVKISDGKKNSDPVLYMYFPTFSGNEISKESVFYAMAAMEYNAKTMIDDGLKSTLKWNKIFNKHNEGLKDNTIYVLEGWLEEGLTEERVQELYPAPIKVVSFQEWSEAVITKKPNIAYHIISPIPQAGDYTYVHYFMQSGEAKVLGVSYSMINPKFQGPSMSAGSAVSLTVFTKDIDLSKGNIGYVTEKNVGKFAKMIQD